MLARELSTPLPQVLPMPLAEAEQWAAAGRDPAFQAEVREIELAFRDMEPWPE